LLNSNERLNIQGRITAYVTSIKPSFENSYAIPGLSYYYNESDIKVAKEKYLNNFILLL